MTLTDTAALLRMEVGRLRAREQRCRFEPVLHLGRLGSPVRCCAVPTADPLLDAGTRTEVVCRLLEAEGAQRDAAAVWLTRPGEPEFQDDDLAWLAASNRAFGVFGYQPRAFWVVTRTGWLDVRTGDRRTWKRLRV